MGIVCMPINLTALAHTVKVSVLHGGMQHHSAGGPAGSRGVPILLGHGWLSQRLRCRCAGAEICSADVQGQTSGLQRRCAGADVCDADVQQAPSRGYSCWCSSPSSPNWNEGLLEKFLLQMTLKLFMQYPHAFCRYSIIISLCFPVKCENYLYQSS